MDAASEDVNRQGRGESRGVAGALGPQASVEPEVSLEEILARARSLADGLTDLNGPDSQGHTLRLARALANEVVELIQDARKH
jgi:hypothetical protein